MTASLIAAGAETTLLNAFTFLAEQEAVGDHQAEDILFLTYNADLGFLEARLLGLCQAAGARVTVVADGHVWAPDLRAVRHAGRSYHVGLVDTSAAFHPKLMVLVGPKRALATVGSGNLTLGGWQYNSELVTAFTGDTETMPKAFGDIRDLLRTLTQTAKLDSLTTEAIERITGRLEALLAGADVIDTGHQVASSWDGPIISLLPTGPVAELLLYAPFHDPGSAALKQVLARTQPSTVRLAVQSGWTHLDSTALSRVINDYVTESNATVEVVEDLAGKDGKKPRYRHGKLIEWVTQSGQRSALTGSPNLSVVALLKAVESTTAKASGGNYEIAVVGPITESLFPDGSPIDPSTVTTVAVEDDDKPTDKDAPIEPRLLASTRTEIGIRILLGRVSDVDTTVEISHRANPPEQWDAVGTLPANAGRGEFATEAVGGSRVRLTWAHPVTGLRTSTAPVFISDPNNVRHRPLPTSTTSRTHQASPLDVFGEDLGWLTALGSDLATFTRDVVSTHGPKSNQSTGPAAVEESAQADSDTHAASAGADPWLWLQDDTARKFGPGLAAYALALPALPTGDGATVRWADKTSIETDIGLEGDTAEAIESDDLPSTPDPAESAAETIDHSDASERLKAARRRWAAKATDIAPSVTLPSRLLILRITLTFWTAGNWETASTEPEDLAIRLLETLNVTGTPPELESRIAALTAIALTLIRERVDLTVRDDRFRRYRTTSAQFAHLLLAGADEDLIEDYVQGLRNKNHGPLDPDIVVDLVSAATAEDPLGELQTALEYRGYHVARPEPHLLHVRGTFAKPFQVALDALGPVEEVSGIGVWAENDAGDWALAVWNKPDLVTVSLSGRRWRHQRLTGSTGPAAIAAATRREGPATRFDIVARPKHAPTREARAVLAAVGIETPKPPERP